MCCKELLCSTYYIKKMVTDGKMLGEIITYGVTALQNSNNRTISLYSEYRGSKLQALTKMVVTTNKLRYGVTIFAIVLAMNREMDY